MNDQPQTSELARAVQDVTERAQILIREEIELAKAEMITKGVRLAKGLAFALIAGIFLLFALIYFLHGASYGIWNLLNFDGEDVWAGYMIVAGLIFVLGIVLGLLGARFVKKGAPPTPNMAIEEAQLIRQTVSGDGPTPARRDR